jgi:hypothetical protein
MLERENATGIIALDHPSRVQIRKEQRSGLATRYNRGRPPGQNGEDLFVT